MTQILDAPAPASIAEEKPFNLELEISTLAGILTDISNKETIEAFLFKFTDNYVNHLQKVLLDKKLFFTGKDNITDDDVFSFLMLSVKTKMKLIKKLTNETPFKNWMEVERKMRIILNRFANDLDGSEDNPHDPHRLFEISALAFLGMFQFGKWSNEK